MLKAVLFDFDGTIADTLPVCIESFRQTVEPVLGKPMTLEDVYSYFGPTEEGIFHNHFPEREKELLEIFYERYAALQAEGTELAPGVIELIVALKQKGIRVALVTAKGAGSCKISLDYFGIAELFEQIEVGSPNGRAKADSIRKVLADMNLEPEDVVYVGDSPKDAISAKKANVRAWGAAWFPSADPEAIKKNQPEAIFATVEEMKRALEKELGSLESANVSRS